MKRTIWYVPVENSTGKAETKFFQSREGYNQFEQSNKDNILGDPQSLTVDGEITGLNYHDSGNTNQSQSQDQNERTTA